MLTVDYDFYTDTYHGALEEEEFERLSVFASAYLDELTMGRIADELSGRDRRLAALALCALCDARAIDEAREGIAAETNDGISVTYAAAADGGSPAARRLYDAAAVYLAPSGLLYRGVNG